MAGRIVVIRLASLGVVFLVGTFSVLFGLVVGVFGGAVWGITAAATTFFLIIFVGGNLFLVGAVLRRKFLLDKAFTPLGLEGGMYRLHFRRYRGDFEGRSAEVYFYRGPVLDILVNANLRTRAGFTLDYGDTAAFAQFLDRPPFDHGVAGMESVRVWTEDTTWARQAMMDPLVSQELRTLLSEREFFVRSVVKVFPGYAQLQLSGNQNMLKWSISPENAKLWVETLARFAGHLETRVPRPAADQDLTKAEEFALSVKRKDTSGIIIFFALGLIAFFAVVTVIVAIFVAVLANL